MDGHRAAVRGPPPRDGRAPSRVPRGLLRLPRGDDPRSRALARPGTSTSSPVTDVFTDPTLRGIAWFTLWQAALSTLLTLAVALPAAYVVSRRALSRPRVGARRVDRALRAADGRGRFGLSSARHQRVARGDPPRSRLLQLRRGRLGRRRPVGPPRPPRRGSRARAGREPSPRVRHRHAARPAPGDRGGRRRSSSCSPSRRSG